MNFQPLQFINPEELKDLILENSQNKDFIVIDLRGDDFENGHIVNCINKPSELFAADDEVDAVLEEFKEKDLIVVHCFQSQQRGPTCATRLLARRSLMGPEDAPPPTTPEICVLRGGWERFAQLYSEDTRLCEGTT
mmetsp:Transcript_33302/g.43928  ORF Transcript_33302/g.43928 Transcript_33302/m.43928 type:complete len:136 (+) Transcript_33302:161-568(+)|eukprot:CAMPEP_0117762518 /NCGR_PEP_ID=MMETSP0947-20121206/17983_1 /TAXON_ID=44440 /ORGANISM="Chattonella subsalsa, Strain CCMP2191" /LENGTH=135 /DNA_ID=CAMNT_0005583835 /DNA_START=114 /DNA_END=521 /DNA_ORIENTATION=+